MRYILFDSQHIQAVKHITHAGQRISNPPDALVDELQLGYPYDVTNSPNLDDNMQLNVSHEYILDNSVIRDSWTILDETTNA